MFLSVCLSSSVFVCFFFGMVSVSFSVWSITQLLNFKIERTTAEILTVVVYSFRFWCLHFWNCIWLIIVLHQKNWLAMCTCDLNKIVGPYWIILHSLNLCTVKPVLTATSEQQAPVNNDRIKSPAQLNLLGLYLGFWTNLWTTATFLGSQRWPLYTGWTVYVNWN